MKEQLIKHIEAYVAARISGNETLIGYAIQILTQTINEVFKDDSSIVKK